MIYIPADTFLDAAFWALYDNEDPPSIDDFRQLIEDAVRVATRFEEVAMNLGYIDPDTKTVWVTEKNQGLRNPPPAAPPPWAPPESRQRRPAQATQPGSPER